MTEGLRRYGKVFTYNAEGPGSILRRGKFPHRKKLQPIRARKLNDYIAERLLVSRREPYRLRLHWDFLSV